MKATTSLSIVTTCILSAMFGILHSGCTGGPGMTGHTGTPSSNFNTSAFGSPPANKVTQVTKSETNSNTVSNSSEVSSTTTTGSFGATGGTMSSETRSSGQSSSRTNSITRSTTERSGF